HRQRSLASLRPLDVHASSTPPGFACRRATLHHVSHCVNNGHCRKPMSVATRQTRARLSREETRARIVAAATELVRELSYAELSVGAVMERAGLERTIFYRHADDLLALLMRPASEPTAH